MRTGKAAGRDGIAPECLKKGGKALVEWLVRLLGICFEAGEVPADWRMAAMVPIYKGKGDKYVCGNYRGISLLSMVGKIFRSVNKSGKSWDRRGTDGGAVWVQEGKGLRGSILW